MTLNRVVRSGLAASLALAIAACGGQKGASDPDAPLAFVPAQSPYVFANLEPIPRPVSESWLRLLEPLQAGYHQSLTRAREVAAGKNDPDADKMLAFMELFADKFSLEGWEKVGFNPQGLFALYGVGVQPVMRMSLSDPERFRAFVAEVEGLVGKPAPVAEVDGQSYWRFQPDKSPDFAVVVAIIGGQLVAALDIAHGEPLPVLLGLQRPQQAMVDGADLRAINKQYGYLDYGTFLVDSRRLLDAAIGADDNASTLVTRMAAADGQPPLSAACRSELQGMAANTPRMVAGYTRLDETHQNAGIVLETENSIAQALKALAAPVAGLGAAREGIEFGFSMRLDKLAEFIQARASAIRANPYTCEYLAGLNQGAEDVGQQLAGLYMAAGLFTGARILVTDFQTDATGKPSSFDGAMVLTAPNPASLIAMAKGFVPQLAQIDLVPGAAPTAIDLAQMGVPDDSMGPAYAAITDSSIGLSIGSNADTRLSGYLGEAATTPAPLFHMGYSGAFYGKIMRQFESAFEPGQGFAAEQPTGPESGDDEDAGVAGADADTGTRRDDGRYVMEPLMKSLSQIYDRLGFVSSTFYTTDRGVEVTSSTSLN